LTSSIGADQRRGAASHSTMRTIDVDGAPLVLRLWGSEGGRPLFFWHALGPAASGATIGEVAPVLAERGFRVCAVDGPGFGASPVRAPDRYELEPLLGLVDAVFDESAGSAPFWSARHSSAAHSGVAEPRCLRAGSA
jgi:pimeloyl-ACP methyl ester carboxylesterase